VEPFKTLKTLTALALAATASDGVRRHALDCLPKDLARRLAREASE
jgi:hypothetical protein